jgi:muramoyltetrapeptide carboxypeptidase
VIRIAICAPGKRLRAERAEAARDRAKAFGGVELHFHDQCFLENGHFAGSDEVRLAALLDCANDPGFDAVWFAMGGYGSNRIAAAAVSAMNRHAKGKAYLGHSDTGFLLAALYRAGIGRIAHGPLVGDIKHGRGEAAERALGWLTGSCNGVEDSVSEGPCAAFNLTVLAMLLGTKLAPDFKGHVIMVEEVAEHLYAIDRLFFHVTCQLRGIAGLRLGRISAVPANDRPFGADEVAIARDWCRRSGIPYLGRADIGHDEGNKIVPFGTG